MKETSDTKFFLVSIALHLSLILIFTLKVVIFPGERPEFVRAVRVDFVALPDKDPTEGPEGVEKPVEEKKAEEKKVEEKKPPAAKIDTPKAKETKQITSPDSSAPVAEKSKIKEEQSSALKRIEALAKIKKLRQLKATGPEGTQYKGNQLSDGNSLTGVEKLEFNKYLSNLDLHIKRNWHLPEWLADRALAASLLVRFDENGQLVEKRLLKSSGNSEFDKAALQAVMDSLPLPPPPENLISYFKVHGIELRFPE